MLLSMDSEYSLDLLWDLLARDSPAGDEAALSDWLEEWLKREVPDAVAERLGDSLVITRGLSPKVAVFAHLDTTGWTLGYDKQLLRIGGPAGRPDDAVRPVRRPDTGCTLARRKDGGWKVSGKTDAAPGTRFVYAAVPEVKNGQITAPYLDNRAGLWAALHALKQCPEIALALSVQEETGSLGAGMTARHLNAAHGIQQALVADLTWDTKHIKCGSGVAVSLRDSSVPRQSYLSRVLALAEKSGILFQREIEAHGGSDGVGIERSGVPLDWVFVGAPEKNPHTARERVQISDLQSMAALLVSLVNGLSENAT